MDAGQTKTTWATTEHSYGSALLGLGLNDEETTLGNVQIQIKSNNPQSNFLLEDGIA